MYMGIPSLFRVLLQDDPSLFHKNAPSCHYFYLDYNCLIHHASRLINTGSDEDVITQVVSYTRTLINDIVKSDFTYIAMDGPVPVSKMIRQRERRFKKTLSGGPQTDMFDSTKITPGTEFMHKLSQRIQSLVSLRVFRGQVCLSDSCVPGEGEWKIFQHLKTVDPNAHVCIYGLDADLIVWSMASHRIRNTVLCREDDDGVLMFFELYKSLNLMLRKKHNLDIHNPDVLWDIVLVLMLGGNDFVCPIEYLKIRNNGWTHLFECYVKFGQRLVSRKKVNWNTFYSFLQYTSSYEDVLSKKMYTRQLRASSQHYPVDHEQEYEHLPFSSIKNPLYPLYGLQSISIPYFDNHQVWKPAYYERIFGHPFTIPGFMDTLCRDYIASIIWCWEYYTNPVVPSWSFCYEHIAAPCLTDVVFWYHRVFQASVQAAFTPGTCLTPIEQLVCVVPLPVYGYLLPDVIQWSLTEVPENPMFEYQTDDFLVEPITGQKMIYAPPLLPRLDVPKIRHFVQMLEEHFDEKEHVRNTLRME